MKILLILIIVLGISSSLAGQSVLENPDAVIPPLRIQSAEEYEQMPSTELIGLMEEYIQRGEELYAMEQYRASYPYIERSNVIGDILLERARRTRDLMSLRELAEQRLREATEAVGDAGEKVR